MRTANTVTHLLKTKTGDIGGILLKSGVIIDTPPGHSETLRALLKKGDRVKVEGTLRQTKSGKIHVHANKIRLSPRRAMTHLANGSERLVLEANGEVRQFSVNQNGERNGFQLTDGTNVIAPRRNREQIFAHLHLGHDVYVEGHRVLGSKGTPRLIADRIHLRNGKVKEMPCVATGNI